MAVRPRRRGRPARRGANPFARDPSRRAGAATPARRSSTDFRIVGSRVFCLRGDRELIAFDGDTGPGRLVVHARPAARSTRTSGRPAADRAPGPQAERGPGPRDRRPAAAAPSSPRPRTRSGRAPPLPIDDDHVALVADRRTVALFDLTPRGRTPGSSARAAELPKHGPPAAVRRRRAAPGRPRRQRADPARPGDRARSAGRGRSGSRT